VTEEGSVAQKGSHEHGFLAPLSPSQLVSRDQGNLLCLNMGREQEGNQDDV